MKTIDELEKTHSESTRHQATLAISCGLISSAFSLNLLLMPPRLKIDFFVGSLVFFLGAWICGIRVMKKRSIIIGCLGPLLAFPSILVWGWFVLDYLYTHSLSP